MTNRLLSKLFDQFQSQRGALGPRLAASVTSISTAVALTAGSIAGSMLVLPLNASTPSNLPTLSKVKSFRQDIRLSRQPNESYTGFTRRSEVIARAAIQRNFDRDLNLGAVVIYIIGMSNGSEAPVMSVEVSREQWQQRPDAKRWASYYRMSRILLGFGPDADPMTPSGPTASPTVIPIAPVEPIATPAATPAAATPTPTPSPAEPIENPNKN